MPETLFGMMETATGAEQKDILQDPITDLPMDETAAPDRVVLRTVTIKEEKQALIVLKVQVREQNDILLLPKQVRQDLPEVATVITNLDLPDREAVNQ